MKLLQEQEVLEVGAEDGDTRAARDARRRQVIAGPAGLALLMAGGGLLIRVALLTFQNEGLNGEGWLFTAVACVLAGVALLLIALPKVNPNAADEDAGRERPPTGIPTGTAQA